MYIRKVSLVDFRNYRSIDLELDQGVNIFYGANAQGKTNFLEAIYFCATSRTRRTNFDKELIHFGENKAHIQMFVENGNNENRLDIHIKKEGKKGIAVNGLSIKRLGELFGILYCVSFSPEDLLLIKSGPQERRRFMDLEICQMNSTYYYNLKQYYKILKQRNNLLKNLNKNKSLRDTIFVWDSQLVEYGIKIIQKRREFITNISEISQNIYSYITHKNENGILSEKLEIIYKPNVLEEDFLNKLKKNVDRDIVLGSTSVGIHKDDIVFTVNNMDLKIFGSQGQQRTACLATKLAEIELIKEEKGEDAVLLLDDVLSELDKSRQKYLVNYIKNNQTIITATGVEDIINKLSINSNIKTFNVINGMIF